MDTPEAKINEGYAEEMFWETAARTKLGKYLTDIETHFISDVIKVLEPHMMLDIGAGAGKFSLLAAKSNINVVSLDLVSYGLKRLKLNNKGIHIIKADARKIPLRNEIFDAISMIEVIDYIPELAEVFTDCNRTLKKDASFSFSFGNKASIKQKLRQLRGKSYLHSYNSIMKNLSRAGFKVRKKQGYNWLPFGRTSENRLVPLFAFTEMILGLRRIPSLSPWVMIHAKKSH
jgi:ubiquinone/menaquinone biosynthesis C-methylase UbiE